MGGRNMIALVTVVIRIQSAAEGFQLVQCVKILPPITPRG